eukprot:2836791-Prymnesium_polylepis.1
MTLVLREEQLAVSLHASVTCGCEHSSGRRHRSGLPPPAAACGCSRGTKTSGHAARGPRACQPAGSHPQRRSS